MFHSTSAIGAIHIPYNWEYADQTAREAATGFVTADLGKLARQTDSNGLFMLVATTPTWHDTGGGGGSSAVTLNEPAGDNSAGTQAIFDSAIVGESVAFPDLLYLNSDGKWWKSDADAASTMPGLRMALESKTADATCSMLVIGRVRDDDWAWTIGGLIYADTAAGGYTQTAPNGTGDQVQIVGIAYHADKMIFDPSPVIAEVV